MTLLAFNKTDSIKELWEVVRAIYIEPEYQIIAARRLREAMMKASILVGFPKVFLYLKASDLRVLMVLVRYEVVLQRNLQ